MPSAHPNRPKQDPDFEKAYKLPKHARFFNVSVLWIFYYPQVVRGLYRLGIRHEAVTLLSLFFGVISGFMFLKGGYLSLLLAALFVHLKDLFDACDGSLARLTQQTNRIARFMDSLCDFAAITWIITAIAIRLYPSHGLLVIGLAGGAWVSVFIQCSYFNYYLVSYIKNFHDANVRRDERLTNEDKRIYSVYWKRYLLIFFQSSYQAVYGWQDRLIASVDRRSIQKVFGKTLEHLGSDEQSAWYGDKMLLTLNTPLCFGTHLFILILSSVLSRPEFFYYAVLFAGNSYLLSVYRARVRLMTRRTAREQQATV